MAEPRAKTRSARRPPPAFTLTTGWAAAILALLTVLFFHEVVLGGRTFSSPDATGPAGFVRIGAQSLFHDHVYPLWNPFVFLGMPSFGSGAYNPLIYPPDWPVGLLQRLVPVLPDMTWLLLYYYLAGVFAFLLAREWGARAEGALLAAVAFVFQPNLVAIGTNGHGSQLVDSAYLPLLLWLATRWLRRGSPADLGWLALAGGFQFLRGHVQVCFYTWLAVAVYAVVELAAAVRRPGALPATLARAAALGGAAALAFGVAGVYDLPLRDYARWSIRGSGDAGGGVGMPYATAWSMAPYELPAIVFPNWVGFGGGTYWGAMPFTDYPNAYLGIVAVLLALPAFLAGGAPRVFALVLGAFALLVSLGRFFPLYGFLYAHVPQFNKFRIPVMIVLLFQLAAALGLAWGWSAVLGGGETRPKPRLPRLLAVAAAALLALGAVAALGGGGLHAAYVAYATRVKPGFPPQAADAAWSAFAGDLGRGVALGLAALALAWLAAGRRLSAGLASVGVLALLLVDVWPVSGRVMLPVIAERQPASLDAGRDDVVDFLVRQGPWGSFRVLVLGDEFQSNRYAGFGIATVGGYHAAKPRLFQDLLDAGVVSPTSAEPHWLALLDVRFVVTPQPLPPQQTPPFLAPVFQGQGGAVYRNVLALPRATLVGAWGLAPDRGRAAIDSIAAGTRDAARFTWLSRDPGFLSAPLAGGTATITRYTLHEVDVDTDAPAPAVLRLADLWYPDWQVSVDGRPAELLRADHALRAVAVPAGRHRVAFRFVSPAVRHGLELSLASLVAALLLVASGAWGARRAPAAAPAGAGG